VCPRQTGALGDGHRDLVQGAANVEREVCGEAADDRARVEQEVRDPGASVREAVEVAAGHAIHI